MEELCKRCCGGVIGRMEGFIKRGVWLFFFLEEEREGEEGVASHDGDKRGRIRRGPRAIINHERRGVSILSLFLLVFFLLLIIQSSLCMFNPLSFSDTPSPRSRDKGNHYH